MRRISTTLSLLAVALVVAAACSSGDGAIPLGSRPDDATTTLGSTIPAGSSSLVPDADVAVRIDATQPGAAISPLIVGLSSTLTVDGATGSIE